MGTLPLFPGLNRFILVVHSMLNKNEMNTRRHQGNVSKRSDRNADSKVTEKGQGKERLIVEQVQERPGFTYCNIHRGSTPSLLAITLCMKVCTIHSEVSVSLSSSIMERKN